jgi:ribonuclease BN (tRNA processing enzyme)
VKLTILGSGTGVPSLDRSSPAYLLQAGELRCLVDCGSGTLHQLLRAGASCDVIDAVFVTHTHPDHIGDLVPLIHALKLTLGLPRRKPLHLFGPPGFEAFYAQCVASVATPPRHFPVEVREVGTGLEFAGLRIATAPTVHSDRMNSIAYRFEQGGRALVLSGDCDYDAGIVALAKEADTLVIDCSFPDDLKLQGHLSAGECGRIAREAGVCRLVLSHLYPVEGSRDTRLAEARAACECAVCLAQDLMELEC